VINKPQKKLVIVHGIWAGPDTVWLNWVADELRKRGFEVIAPQMPNPIFPILYEWLDTIKTYAGDIDENTYFLGHSLGCVTIANFLAGLSGDRKIGGAVFVAGFCRMQQVPFISNFCDCNIDWPKLRDMTRNYTLILSTTDHIVPMYLGEEFASKLDADVIIEKNKGHFTHYAGVFRLPSALTSLLIMSGEL